MCNYLIRRNETATLSTEEDEHLIDFWNKIFCQSAFFQYNMDKFCLSAEDLIW